MSNLRFSNYISEVNRKINSFEYHVFICHSSKDKPIIANLIEDFKKDNITYWIEAEQIVFGDDIIERIEDGLLKSMCFMPCVSKNLKTSGWTNAEYGLIINAHFCGQSKSIMIPLILDDCEDEDIPFSLRDKRRVTYSNKIEFGEFIKFLKKKNTTPSSLSSPTGISVVQTIVKEIPKTFTSPSTSMKLILIPSGEFIMGSPEEEMGRDNYEGPVQKVTIREPFYLGKYPVTQKQWKAVMGSNPSYYSSSDDLPVEQVSWYDAQAFIKKLNQMEKTDKYYLPSEAKWEYACRAGTTTKYSFGDDESMLNEYARYSQNGYSDNQTHSIGQKKPNPWGLYDMHGNVREWCQDKWNDNLKSVPFDGSAWDMGK